VKGHYALCFKTRASFGAHHENLNEDRLYYQRRKCSAVTLDSDSIRFMRIFAVVLKIYLNFPQIWPASIYYVYMGRNAVVVFKFKCLLCLVFDS